MAEPHETSTGRTPPIAVTIAGSDSSGGAGIQADLKTFTMLGVYGASVITAITAQNTRGVTAVQTLPALLIRQQFDAVMDDLDVAAVKTGMLADEETVTAVITALKARKPRWLVVDPVMVATSGDVLLSPGAITLVRDNLLPLADIVTPNLAEAARLLGTAEASSTDDMQDQAQQLLSFGARAVLIKGGHASADHGQGDAVDVLATANGIECFALPRVATANTHGTGCTLSAAIAAKLASGSSVIHAVETAKRFVHQALVSGANQKIGYGNGPVDHMHILDALAGHH